MIWFWIAGYLFTSAYAPVTKWYDRTGLMLFWPLHLGEHMRKGQK